MNRLPKRFTRACLAAVLLCGLAWGQETDDHGAPAEIGRGDVHSEGWKKVQELKGAPVSPRFPAVGEAIQREVLDNGLVLYLREDRSLPLVRAELVVRSGSYYETPEQIGLASITAEQMRAGGTARMGATELSDRLAFLAADINSDAREETARVSLDVLSEHLAEGMQLFADVIRRPAFDPQRLELAKRERLFRLRHRNDSPQFVLSRELERLLFTAAHPRGREARPENILGWDRDALVAFHHRFYTPDRAYLAVVGDFSAAAMREQVRELFGDWKANGETLPSLPRVETRPRPGIYVVDRDLNQSSIALVQWGVERTNKDRAAIDLMNTILGGGSFSSRITERVRSDEGLAYSARSRFPIDSREPDLFQATVQTKTESTAYAVRLIREEIEKMRGGEISKNEFDTAKESILYSYVFRFDDPVDNVIRLMNLEIEGLPADWYAKEFSAYQAASAEDVARAGRTYLRPQDLTIFIVGKLDAFRDELAALGDVHVVEVEEFELPQGGRGPGDRPGGRRPDRGGAPSSR